MVAFRKLFPALAVVTLLFGATSAYGQGSTGAPLQCTANSGVPPVLRAEGYTELTGDLVISCTGGNPAAPFFANFQLFLNTNITSRLLTVGGQTVSEALLMIDEPGLPRLNQAGGAGTPTPFCPGTPGAYGAASTCNPAAPAETYQSGFSTVFYGQRVAEGVSARENALVWAGVPVVPPGSNRTRTFRFTNVRANANGLGASQTLIPTQVVAFVSVFPPGTLPIDNPQQTVGYVQQGMIFDVRNCANDDAVSVGLDQCSDNPGGARDFFNDPLKSGTLTARGAFRFREGFQTAFKPQVEVGQEGANPGAVFNSESGFVRSASFGTYSVGLADSGTRLAVRFNNVPANLKFFVSVTDINAGTGASTTPRAVYVTTDPSGASNIGTPAPRVPTAPFSQGNLSCGTAANVAMVEVPITNGTGVAVWETTNASGSINDELLFSFGVAFNNRAGSTQVGLGTATVIGNLAPFYSTTAAATMQSLLPIPRFAARTDSNNAVEVRPCRTNLLFPYVTNWAGFDTGIAIANTSDDRSPTSAGGSIGSNTTTDRIQAGRCRMNYYGRLANGNAPTRLQETTDRDVAAGETITFVLSTGGGLGIQGNANFQGYIIAQCDFRFAHGFAFITDGPIGQARVAEGYLALVIDGPDASGRLRGSTTGESRGH